MLDKRNDKIRAQLEKALLYIESNLSNNLTAGEIAKHAHLSPFHFQRLFSAYMGEPVGHYCLTRRLEKSAQILAEIPGINLLDLALDVGFETHSSFSKTFKKHFGIPPSAFSDNPVEANVSQDQKRPYLLPTNMGPQIKEPNIINFPEFEFQYRQSTGATTGTFFIEQNQDIGRQFNQLLTQSKGQCKLIASCFPEQPQSLNDEKATVWFGGIFDQEINNSWSNDWYHFEAGEWAQFNHIGNYAYLYQTWNSIYRRWLAQTDWLLRDELPFETYISDPINTDPDKLITKIYIPVKNA